MVVSLSSSSGCLGIIMINADWPVTSLRYRCHMKIFAAGLVNVHSTCSREHHAAGEK
jgi:hypothetical protein